VAPSGMDFVPFFGIGSFLVIAVIAWAMRGFKPLSRDSFEDYREYVAQQSRDAAAELAADNKKRKAAEKAARYDAGGR